MYKEVLKYLSENKHQVHFEGFQNHKDGTPFAALFTSIQTGSTFAVPVDEIPSGGIAQRLRNISKTGIRCEAKLKWLNIAH